MQSFKIINKEYSVSSTFCTLSDIVNDESLFNIPIYQRLFVWGDDQIRTLLEDLNKGFIEKTEHYYLGGVMVSLNQEGKYDLIDGQQRFTTLWLIGSIIKNDLVQFNYLTGINKRKARLSFSIRDYANDFFNNTEDFKNTHKYATENLTELQPIDNAIRTIKRYFEDNHFDETVKKEFSEFVMNSVLFMVTEMPKNTDENKLFEVLNNRGVQLQHHEILKARLLKHILNSEERSQYAKLWDACSIMDEYIEKNIKDIAGLTWKDLTFQPDETEKQVDIPDDILFRIKAIEEVNKTHLLAVLTDKNKQNKSQNNDNNGSEIGYDSGKVESIISFPMLLLHVLRIYQFEFDKTQTLPEEEIVVVDEKKFLKIFEKGFNRYLNLTDKREIENNVKEFFRLLWKIRIGFDKHIIKWIIKDNNLKIHGIKKLYLNKDALQRKESEKNDGFALLQSMLYHSQQIITHYWLTPLLNMLRTTDDPDDLYAYLIKIDNAMFCAGNTLALSQRSWQLLREDITTIKPAIKYLQIDDYKGTDYPSYIFYKLDFVLWYLRDHVFEEKHLVATRKEDWESYRMTSKNSVEHISPQNKREEDQNLVWDENDSPDEKERKLDDLGNLVLLTANMNSEYHSKIYRVKREEFLAKANNKRLDSLKSALIFENETWDWNLCEKHRDEIKRFLTKYFIETV